MRVENMSVEVAQSVSASSLGQMRIDDRLQFGFLFVALKPFNDFSVFENKNGWDDRDFVLHGQLHFVGNVDFGYF